MNNLRNLRQTFTEQSGVGLFPRGREHTSKNTDSKMIFTGRSQFFALSISSRLAEIAIFVHQVTHLIANGRVT